jgi:hypothetical protein
LNNGVAIGPHVQGVTVSQSNFTGNYSGIGVPGGEVGLDQLTVSGGNQFNNAIDLNILSTFPNLVVSGNGPFIVGTGQIGINYSAASWMTTITGNTFNASLGTSQGIVLNGSGTPDTGPAAIVGNNFNGLGTAVMLSTNSTGALVSDNVYTGNTVNVVNNGSATNSIKGLGGAFAVVTAVANNGSGKTRLTFTSGPVLVTGQWVSVSGVNYPSANVVTQVAVVDSTHVDLPAVFFSGGPYSGGGVVSTLP